MLHLARSTGWSEAELMRMPLSRLTWWLEGLAEFQGGRAGEE